MAASAQEPVTLRPLNEVAKPESAAIDRRVSPMAPAPRLTSVAVYAVGSSQYSGWEITYRKYSTTYDHGGPVLLVAVEEWGYAGVRNAWYNGTRLPASAQYGSDPICGGTPANPAGCSAGESPIAWIRYWKLDGYPDSGDFQYEASSANGPGTYSTHITIK